MAYAAYTDIQAEFKDITFSASTAVTTAMVTEFIVQEEAAINAQIGGVYSVPITASGAVSIMKLMSTLMVKARILDILAVKTGNKTADQGGDSKTLRARVDALLKGIRDKSITLAGATLANSTGGIQSYTSLNDIDPVFKKGCDQW